MDCLLKGERETAGFQDCAHVTVLLNEAGQLGRISSVPMDTQQGDVPA